MDIDQLKETVSQIVAADTTEKSRKSLIRSLNPVDVVPVECIIQLMGAFQRFKIDSKLLVLNLFPVFFHYIDYDNLRPVLCHILCRIARKSDVLPFRARRLLQILTRVGKDAHLLGLLVVFRDYSKDIVAIPSDAKRPSLKNPDPRWFKEMMQVRSEFAMDVSSARPTTADVLDSLEPASVERVKQVLKISTAKQSASVVPLSSSVGRGLSVDQVKSMDELIKNIRTVRMPNQMALVFQNRFLMHIVALQADGELNSRIESWVAFALEDEFFWKNDSPTMTARRDSFLQQLAQYAEFAQECPVAMEHFLFRYIRQWDGVSHVESVVKLLSYLHPASFEDIQGDLLKPLEKVITFGTAESVARIMWCFTTLLRRWISIDVSNTSPSKGTHYMFASLPTNADYYLIFSRFVKYVERLIALSLDTHREHPLVMHSAWSFFELVCTFHVRFRLPFVALPGIGLVYRSLLSNYASPISRCASTLAQYKAEFNNLKDAKLNPNPPALTFPSGLNLIENPFNVYVMDFCDGLWRNYVFEQKLSKIQRSPILLSTEAATLFGLQQVRSSVLALTSSSAFSAFAREFLLQERHNLGIEEFDPKHIRDKHRIAYLDWLQQRGLTGIADFLYGFLKTLPARAPRT